MYIPVYIYTYTYTYTYMYRGNTLAYGIPVLQTLPGRSTPTPPLINVFSIYRQNISLRHPNSADVTGA